MLGSAHTISRASQLMLLLPLKRAKTSVIELAFKRYPELLNSKREVDLVAQEFKHVMSLMFCNLIGLPRSVCADPNRYRQSPWPSLCVLILKELNAAVVAVWFAILKPITTTGVGEPYYLDILCAAISPLAPQTRTSRVPSLGKYSAHGILRTSLNLTVWLD